MITYLKDSNTRIGIFFFNCFSNILSKHCFKLNKKVFKKEPGINITHKRIRKKFIPTKIYFAIVTKPVKIKNVKKLTDNDIKSQILN